MKKGKKINMQNFDNYENINGNEQNKIQWNRWIFNTPSMFSALGLLHMREKNYNVYKIILLNLLISSWLEKSKEQRFTIKFSSIVLEFIGHNEKTFMKSVLYTMFY